MNEVSIRPWQKQDAQALAQIANNRSIWNNLRDALPSPYTVMDAVKWIAHVSEQDPVCNFAVIYGNTVVGSIGCTPKADIYSRNIEVGYFIGEPYWHKGIATRALATILQYVEAKFNVNRIEARTLAHNQASMTVLKRNGFELECTRTRGVLKNNELLDEHVWVRFV